MKQQVMILPAPLFDISSTLIRQKIKNSESVVHLLPASVMEYIHEQRLYRD
jgi:nicotinate-nucleotide adenylyltransferase